MKKRTHERKVEKALVICWPLGYSSLSLYCMGTHALSGSPKTYGPSSLGCSLLDVSTNDECSGVCTWMGRSTPMRADGIGDAREKSDEDELSLANGVPTRLLIPVVAVVGRPVHCGSAVNQTRKKKSRRKQVLHQHITRERERSRAGNGNKTQASTKNAPPPDSSAVSSNCTWVCNR